MTVEFALLLVASYLLGAIPTSLLAARFGAGVDLREVGSRNLGATNLFRVLGWRYAIPVALIDAGKGTIPVLLFAPLVGVGILGALGLGAAAIVGHVFSVFVRFRGGKGVATSAGAVLGIAPIAFLVSLAVFSVTVRVSGYVSLGSLLGALVFPIAVLITGPEAPEVFWFGVVLAVLIAGFHQANIRRLLKGTESRFGHSGDGGTNGSVEGRPDSDGAASVSGGGGGR